MKSKSINDAAIHLTVKRSIKALIFSVVIIISMTQILVTDAKDTTDQERIVGIWMSKAKDSKMQIYKSSNSYNAKLLAGWGNQMFEKGGVTLIKDIKNQNIQLRNRTLLNMEFISGLAYENGKYINGKLYIAQAGRTFSCKMKLMEDKLIVRLYIGLPVFGVNKIFTRID